MLFLVIPPGLRRFVWWALLLWCRWSLFSRRRPRLPPYRSDVRAGRLSFFSPTIAISTQGAPDAVVFVGAIRTFDEVSFFSVYCCKRCPALNDESARIGSDRIDALVNTPYLVCIELISPTSRNVEGSLSEYYYSHDVSTSQYPPAHRKRDIWLMLNICVSHTSFNTILPRF